MSKSSKFVMLDGTPKFYTSARQENSRLYFTSRFDDLINEKRGDGESMLFVNNNAEKTMVIEGGFLDDIYLKDGYVMWENARMQDNFSMEIILPANTYFPSRDRTGNYDLVNGEFHSNSTNTGNYLKYPQDIVVDRFINECLMLGTNTKGILLESSDTVLISKKLKIRLIVSSPTTNPDLRTAIIIETYREKSV